MTKESAVNYSADSTTMALPTKKPALNPNLTQGRCVSFLQADQAQFSLFLCSIFFFLSLPFLVFEIQCMFWIVRILDIWTIIIWSFLLIWHTDCVKTFKTKPFGYAWRGHKNPRRELHRPGANLTNSQTDFWWGWKNWCKSIAQNKGQPNPEQTHFRTIYTKPYIPVNQHNENKTQPNSSIEANFITRCTFIPV